MLPSAGEESFFNGRLGADAEVSPHEVEENSVDTKLTEEVRVTVEQLTLLDGPVGVLGEGGGGGREGGRGEREREANLSLTIQLKKSNYRIGLKFRGT